MSPLASLTQRERRVVMSGALVIALLSIAFRGGPAWWGWRERSLESVRLEAVALDQEARTVAGLPSALASAQERVSALRDRTPAPLVVTGTVRAGSSLAGMVHEAANGAGATILPVEIEPPRGTTGGVVLASVVATGSMDAQTLAAFLRNLETGPMLARVRRLTVAAPDVGAAPDHPEWLQVRLEIEAPGLVALRRRDP